MINEDVDCKGNADIEKNDEDYDTSTDIWKMYKQIYTWNIDSQSENKNESNLYWNLEKPVINKNNTRRWAMITLEGLEHYCIKGLDIGFSSVDINNIKISGDIIFNFSYGHCTRQYDKYKKLLGILGDSKKKIEYEKKLEDCKNENYSPNNCALLISNGKLQIAKNSIGDDRGDTFIWALNSYFLGSAEIILNSATPEWASVLRAFLDSFKHHVYPSESIYKYCEEFYNISNRKLIDHLINSGSRAIDTPERVCEYIDLAQEFWKLRNNVIVKQTCNTKV